MIDRLQFTSGINYSVPNASRPKEICKHFEEIMCLYDVMNQIDSCINANIDNDDISFDIHTNSTEDARIIIDRISNLVICKFDCRYHVDGTIYGTNLHLKINKITVSG